MLESFATLNACACDLLGVVAVLTALRHYGRYFSLHQYNVAVKDFRYCNTFETAILLFCLTIVVVLKQTGLTCIVSKDIIPPSKNNFNNFFPKTYLKYWR